jgi:hypothetical protein
LARYSVEIAAVGKSGGLLLDGSNPLWMRMSDRGNCDSTPEIQIACADLVIEVNAFAPHGIKGGRGIVLHECFIMFHYKMAVE